MRKLVFLLLAPALMLAEPGLAQEATIETSLGSITVALDAVHAPVTVANFVAYARAGHYDGTIVYRVERGFVIQMGGFDAEGKARQERAPIPLETAGGLKNIRGTLAMARATAPNTATADFFINLVDNPPLDPAPGAAPNTTGYAVFGRIVSGIGVVDAIENVPLGGGPGPFPDVSPQTPVRILKVTIAGLPPPPVPAGPQVKISTSLGDIVVSLDKAKAPATAANFLRYAKEGFFDGTVVYRVVPRFVIQMGSTLANGKSSGKARQKPVPLETANGLRNERGTLAMARGDTPASATSEFFINLSDNTPLDPKPDAAPNTTGYAVFGQVVAGMEVVDAIAGVPLGGGKGPFPDAFPKTAVKILKVTVGDKPFVP
jgi:cyclophilin family peptidyl-prolyl cis-trans isomerase